MPPFEVGVMLHPQHCAVDEIRRAWKQADELGVDSIWTWDHFFPLYGERDGRHYECWSLLGAMAADTSRARFGAMVTCNSYRNPDLLAHMAMTIDHLSGGRLILGIGAGWFERDYAEYGYEFGTAATRVRALEDGIRRIKRRLERLNPAPAGELPILVGGSGEKITLRITAEHADMWNGFGPAAGYRRKNEVLDRWCDRVGRDPAAIQRTANMRGDEYRRFEELLEAGAQHVIVERSAPFDLEPVEWILSQRR